MLPQLYMYVKQDASTFWTLHGWTLDCDWVLCFVENILWQEIWSLQGCWWVNDLHLCMEIIKAYLQDRKKICWSPFPTLLAQCAYLKHRDMVLFCCNKTNPWLADFNIKTTHLLLVRKRGYCQEELALIDFVFGWCFRTHAACCVSGWCDGVLSVQSDFAVQ